MKGRTYKKVNIAKGNREEVELNIPLPELQKWDEKSGEWKEYKGTYKLCIGKNASDYLLQKPFFVK